MKVRLASIPMGPHPRAIEQKKKMWGELRKETQGGSTEDIRKARTSKKLGSGPLFRKATLSGAKALSPDQTPFMKVIE